MENIKLEVGDRIKYNFGTSKKLDKGSLITEITGEKIYYEDNEFDYIDEVVTDIEKGTAIQTKLATFPILIKRCMDNTYVVIMNPESLPTSEAFMVIATKVVIRK